MRPYSSVTITISSENTNFGSPPKWTPIKKNYKGQETQWTVANGNFILTLQNEMTNKLQYSMSETFL